MLTGAMLVGHRCGIRTTRPALLLTMSMCAELRAAGTAARQLPHAVLQRGCQSWRAMTVHNTRYPVLLVHGYAGTESVWAPVRRALGEVGFGYIVSLSYNCFATDPVEVCAELARQARHAMQVTASPGVHLVGHSLGGLIVRHAVTGNATVARSTATAVSIASPHRGAPLARLAPGRCARIMHPRGSSGPADDASMRTVRWLAYYTDRDRIVPATSARLDPTRYRATNVLIPDCGHLTICRDPRLIRSLVGELIRTETTATPSPRSDLAVDLLAA